jgi:hypothetical protein
MGRAGPPRLPLRRSRYTRLTAKTTPPRSSLQAPNPGEWPPGLGSAQPIAQRRPEGDLDAVTASWTIGSEEDGPETASGGQRMRLADLRKLRLQRRARAGRAPSAEPGGGRPSGAAQRRRLDLVQLSSATQTASADRIGRIDKTASSSGDTRMRGRQVAPHRLFVLAVRMQLRMS